MLIDIEGIDGSGKGTQARRLCDRFNNSGTSATVVSFPRYDSTLFGRAVGEYLNGKFGSLAEVHPFLVSLLFAGDRCESKPFLLDAIARHNVVILDRYVPSNVAHQASKLEGPERTRLIRQILDIEFGIFDLPRPDLVVLLDLPVATAQQLIAKKEARNYTARKADIQEADAAYLSRVRDVYHELARAEPAWHTVSCCHGDRLLAVEEVESQIWQIVQPAVP
jgi:dTMP kinase